MAAVVSDAQSLTLPKATSRSRRRRLPRPPRFSPGQKVALAWDLSLTAIDVASGLVTSPAGLVIVCSLLLDVRAVVLDAIAGRTVPSGRHVGLVMGMWLFGIALMIAGFGP